MNPMNTDPILRDTTLALPVSFAMGFLFGGFELGLHTLFCSVVASLNLKVFKFISDGYLSQIAVGGSGGLYGALLSGKLTLTVAVYVAVMTVVSPLAVGMGLAITLLIAALSGAYHASRAPRSASAVLES